MGTLALEGEQRKKSGRKGTPKLRPMRTTYSTILSALLTPISDLKLRQLVICKYLASYFILLTFFSFQIDAFNVDVKHAQIHRRPNTGFGYAVDFVYASQKRDKFTLLVGAPFAQTSQRGLRNAGAVYGCETDQNVCAEIMFDRGQGNEMRLNGSHLLPIEEKSNQMFGATIVASKNGDSVLACAPHYKYFFSKFEVVEPVGSCFYSQNYFTKIQEFAPCRQEPARHGHHRFGYGMCGFSAAVPGDGDRRLFISGPGVWYWQGAVFSQNISTVRDRPNTADGPAHTDHHMLGYSTTSGDFDGDGVDDVVVGAPRANELIGMVSIYTEKLRSIVNLTDAANGQRGQYFGASVAAADLNKDGKVDLIVGSPFYTDYKSVLDAKTQERKPQYDIGKVYVYIQSETGTFKEPIVLVGHTQWGRFGHAVAAAGDLNGDGYEDIVVGAPFDGEDGRGSIYVYHGSEEGIRREHTQRIDAHDVNRDIRTFGFSLRGGRDIDRNDYPDIAVGAFQSSQAVVLKTRPVMQVTGSIRTTRKTINLDEKMCTTEFGRMPCEKVKFCIKYNGKLQPEFNTIGVKLHVYVDSTKGITPRAFVSRKDLERKRGVKIDPQAASKDQPNKFEQTITLSKGREYCETYDVYVPDTIRDKISPIVISANYTYLERGANAQGLEPASDTTLPQTFETELTIEKDCGSDNICVPDLKITVAKPQKNITLGSDHSLTLNVSVENRGEDSYLTQYYVTIPPGFEYSGLENYETKHKVSCSPSEANSKNADDSYVFVCDIGNPLPANERADFGFKITGNNIDMTKEYVEVKMSVNSTISEETGNDRDNDAVIRVPIEINAQLYLTGRSNPDQIDYSIRNRTQGTAAVFDFEVGPVVSHLFQVRNRGPSVINGATLDIVWPSFVGEGKHLLYLIDMPYVNDPTKAKCRVNQGQNVNPASLAISGEHVAPPKDERNENNNGKPIDDEEDEDEEDTKKEAYEAEEVRLQQQQHSAKSMKHDVYDEEEYLDDGGGGHYRNKRQTDGQGSGRRSRLRVQKARLRDAVADAKMAGTAIDYHGTLSRSTLDCHSLNCTQISCEISRLAEDEFVLVEVFSRLWVNTLIDDQIYDMDISSLALAQITSLPHGPKYTPPPQIVAVTTAVNPIDPQQQTTTPWWWILLAILIALLILCCVIFCCYRCGFFKRNRPHMEKAKLSKSAVPAYGSTPYEATEYYADEGARYAPPHQYQPMRHGARV